jgi:D-alanyl-D-alanine carboxypeptidase
MQLSCPTQEKILRAVFVAVFFLGTGYLFSVGFDDHKPAESTSSSATTPPHVRPFDDLTLEAQSAYIFDIEHSLVLYEKNAEAQLPLASLTKIMTALVAAHVFPENKVVIFKEGALNEEGDYGFVSGQQWRLKDLIDLTLIASANDGAAAIALAFDTEKESSGSFVETMNTTAQTLGLTQTYFLNATGLDSNNDSYATAYGSAHDIGTLFSYILTTTPTLISATETESVTRRALDGTHLSLETTNEAYSDIPWLVAGKTGFTDTAGGNLAIIFEVGVGRPVVAVVLGSTKEGRFEDMTKLIQAVFEEVRDSEGMNR